MTKDLIKINYMIGVKKITLNQIMIGIKIM